MEGGCVAYMTSVDVTTRPLTPLSDIPNVRDLSDVFPTELSGMPPGEKIGFSIELFPGMQPITKAPYRMTFAELMELKMQMEDLMEKGLIKPNVSCERGMVVYVPH